MNLFAIAGKSIRQRFLSSSLTGLSVALGVMLMVAVLVIYGIMDRVFNQQAVGYQLIIGPKGSDMQLVLNTIYRVGAPLQNLPYLYYEELKKDPRIGVAIPVCLGDTTQQGGFPIVGTTEDYFRERIRSRPRIHAARRPVHRIPSTPSSARRSIWRTAGTSAPNSASSTAAPSRTSTMRNSPSRACSLRPARPTTRPSSFN